MPPLYRTAVAFCVALFIAAAPSAQPLSVRASDGADVGGAYTGIEAHVRVAWTRLASPAVLYEVTRSRDGGAALSLGVRSAADSTYLDASAVPGVSYRYCVTPVDAGAATQGCATGSRMLFRPRALRASDSTRVDGVLLEWADLSSVEAGYVVYRTSAGGTLAPLDTTTADATAFLDATAVRLVTSRYCVGLLDRSGGGRGVVAMPLACDDGTRGAVWPPAAVVATDGAHADRVRIAWAPVVGLRYTITRADAGAAPVALASGLAAPPYDDLTALDRVVYTYCVRATAPDGATSVAACDAGRRGGLAAPTAVAATDATSDQRVQVS